MYLLFVVYFFQICCNINIFVSKLKIKARIKKFLQILIYVVAGFLLLMGSLYGLLRTSYVQTSLVKYVTERIEATTGVKIQIEGVDFQPMKSLILNDVLLKDFKNDTLIYCREMKVKIDSFRLVDKSFTVREVLFDQACFHLWISRAEENAATNVEMFLDSLQKGQKISGMSGTLPEERGWLVDLKKVSIRNSHFTYQEEEYEPIEYGVNWTDVDCRELNVDISGFDFLPETTRIQVSGLSFVEKSGLVMKELSGQVQVCDSNLLITGCRIELERSVVDLMKLEFNWVPNQHDWRYFTTRMQQYYELGPSSVSFVDLAYFNEILRGIDNTVKCSGVVSNTIEQLEGHDLYFELGDKSVFQGSFKSAGLPDIWNTVFSIQLHKAHLSPQDLETVYLPWFDMNIPVPEPLHHLSYMDFEKICFDGTLSDFVVKARSVTPSLSGDFSFVYGLCPNNDPDCAAMRGEFDFNRVDFGKLAAISWLGYGELNGTYAGTWDRQGPSFHISTHLEHLKVYQGTVPHIEMTMTYGQDRLDMLAALDNEKIKGGIVLTYHGSDTLNFISAHGKMAVLDLAAWGCGLKGGQEQVETSFDFVHAGEEEKSFTNLSLSDLTYTQDTSGSFVLSEVSIEDGRYKRYNTTVLKSDALDLTIEGNYREVKPLPFVWQLLQNYLPAYSVQKKPQHFRKKVSEDFDFKYVVEIKDINRILDVLYPSLHISSGSTIRSDFGSDDGLLYLTLQADTVRYQDIDLLDSRIDMLGDTERLEMKYTASRIVYGNGYRLYNIRNELVLADNHLDDKLSWCNWEDKTYSGELSACVLFTPDEKNGYTTEVNIHPGVIIMDDSVWRVNESSVFIADKEIQVQDFSIWRGEENLSVTGRLSKDPEQKLYVRLDHFNLSNISRIALKHCPPLFGMVSGTLTVQDYYKDFLLISDFDVADWGIRRDTLGSLHFRSYWDAENRGLVVGAENRVGNDVPLWLRGYYIPQKDTIDVDIRLEKVGLERLGIYVSDYVTESEGWLWGNVRIAGKSDRPDISGFVLLDSVGIKVNALNTNFYVHDSIYIVKNHLLFDRCHLRDRNGNLAILDGEYEVWKNRYKLNVQYSNFLVMNTGFADNESFYGQVYLSGLAELDNKDGINNVTINARTEGESRLYLPLSEGITEQNNNFLHFIDTREPEIPEWESSQASTINLNANLEVNDHLNVQVLFDPTVGDILRTTGNGDIKVAFDKDGSLSMFGEYRILKGDYLFTLSNLVNKKFILTPGGTITWSGSPYDAMLNINAVYCLKTTIAELLPTDRIGNDETDPDEKISSESGRKVPVECILNLSENLNNPVVKFGIDFPTLETQSKSYIQSLFSSQDEINKQMFSLLVLNRFYRTDNVYDYGSQAQTASVTTVTEMMSNQLSRWLSQISNNVDIGLSYRVRDWERDMATDEIELALSTQLLNDRITISANGNMDVGGNKERVGEDSKKTNIAGDFDIEVKLNRQGSLKMKAYSHTDEKLLYNNTETIQGVGISYQESFDTLKELLKKYFGFLRRKK